MFSFASPGTRHEWSAFRWFQASAFGLPQLMLHDTETSFPCQVLPTLHICVQTKYCFKPLHSTVVDYSLANAWGEKWLNLGYNSSIVQRRSQETNVCKSDDPPEIIYRVWKKASQPTMGKLTESWRERNWNISSYKLFFTTFYPDCISNICQTM